MKKGGNFGAALEMGSVGVGERRRVGGIVESGLDGEVGEVYASG